MSLTSPTASARVSQSVALSAGAVQATRRSAERAPLRERTSYSLPELWHLLSLDAPTVAALWMLLLAHCADVTLPWTCGVSLFLGVWMLYAADRLLDARPLPGGEEPSGLEERHRFHRRYRRAFLRMLGASAVLLLVLLPSLGSRTLFLDLALSLALAAWLLLIHFRRAANSSPRHLPKEPMVGLFFGLATAIPTLARAPELLLPLLPFVSLFAGLCTLNCLLLYAWEHGALEDGALEDAGPGSLKGSPVAHITTRWAARFLPRIGGLLILGSLSAGLGTRHFPKLHVPERLASFAFACGLSACLLLLLHANRGRLERLTLRVAGDAVLLTPLVFFHACFHALFRALR